METSFSENIIEDLIIRFFSHELTPTEEQKLFDWINESDDHYLLFDKYRKIWIGSLQETPSAKFDASAALEKLDDRIGSENKNSDVSRFRIKNNVNRLLRIAAIIIISFLLGYSSSFLVNREQPNPDIITRVSAPLGSRSNIVLPDGTTVWLNSGSTLTYKKSFGEKNRHLTLKGEAYFKVARIKNKPFIVHTPFMDVRAVGTTFNVKAYPEDKAAVATLVEGIIKVNVKGKKEKQATFTLKPNQSLSVANVTKLKEETISAEDLEEKKASSGTKTISDDVVQEDIHLDRKVNIELYTSWKDERWTIKGEPLNSLSKLLERRFNVKIHLMSDKLNAYKFTGTIQNETLEQVLQYIKLTAPVKFEIGKGEVWWYTDTLSEIEYSKILNK